MKWSVVVLVVVGILAAISAAILVAYWSGGHTVAVTPSQQPQPKPVLAEEQVDVLYATKALSSLTIVDQQSVVRKKMPKAQAPMVFMSDAAMVVGRALRVGMAEGQAFTPECLADKDSGIHVAAAVPQGMRAATVSLTNYEALHGVLYPGSIVDVMFGFKREKSSESTIIEEAVCMTPMKGVKVLSVNDRTIVTSPPETSGSNAVTEQKETVTLLVTPNQAELLQLAQESGKISLNLRGPLDAETTPASQTLLSQLTKIYYKALPPPQLMPTAEPVATKVPAPAEPPAAPPKPPQWKVTVIHGSNVGEENFPLPEGNHHD
jgi:pilus assembly protein CpaB